MSAFQRGLLQMNSTTTKRLLPSQCRTITSMNKHFQPNKQTISLSNRYHHCGDTNNTDPRTRDYFGNYQHDQSLLFNSSSLDFDPTDTRKVFQSMSTYELIKYNVMFGMLSIEPLTNIMTKIMMNTIGTRTPQQDQQASQTQTPITIKNMRQNKLTMNDIPGIPAVTALLGIAGNILSKPLIYIVRKQYFPLFTGGENIEQCIKLAKKYYDNNIRLIIDNSTEEGDSREVFAHNLALKKELVDVSYDKLGNSVCFMALKMTALSSATLLEQMTEILARENPSDRDPTPYMDQQQLDELAITLETLTEICKYAKKRGIGVWLDAEQYARQNAMNYLSRRLMQIMNTANNEADHRIWLYNTYQCYLKASQDWIAFDIEHAKQNGYRCGVKLVRGAYLDSEGALAANANRPNPIHSTKANTDEAYDSAVNYVMEHIVEYYGNVGIAVCTHNRQSLQNVTDVMNKLGIQRDDPFVYTAQLNGMVDNITYSLGYTGYNALKLMPYGSFHDVWPFLMRRFEENSQMLNGSQQERALYSYEIKRRFGFTR